MRQPVSTLTNAAYAAAGFALGGWYGVSLVALGIASGLFHGTGKRGWQAADECAMYAALCLLSSLHGVPLPLAFLAAAILCVEHPRISSFTWVPILSAVNVLLIAWHTPALAVVLALAAGGAFAIRQWAERRGGAYEDIGHGLWHVLTAFGLGIAGLAP